MRRYPLNEDRSLGLLSGDWYKRDFWPLLCSYRDEAAALGMHGYRYFDYFYLINRVGQAQVTGMMNGAVPLLLAPHFISAALRLSIGHKVSAELHREIVRRYQPAWADVPYMSDLRNKVDASFTESLPPSEYLWSGEWNREFRRVINTPSYFEGPYDRKQIEQTFEAPQGNMGVLQMRGYGLIYRAAFMEFLSDLKQWLAARE